MEESKPTVLCVDDDPDIRESLGMLLRSGGYECEVAPSAGEALSNFGDGSKFSAILVDLMMEEIDSGTSLTKELKARGYKGPIIMLSSVGDSLSVTTDTNALGLAGVLQKPVSRDTLFKLLKEKARR